MRVELPLETPITLFVRIVGEKTTRELRAVLDTGSMYSLIPREDAVQLGYTTLYDPLQPQLGGEGALTVTGSYIIEVPVVTLKEVRLGGLKAENVKAVVWDLPEPSGADVLLGINFLKNFKTTLDYKKGTLTIEEI
ncbi:MAG: TIGR02281 family clan AA aspartic protease [Candidatus Bathyarchaeia archaeon]